MVITIVENIQHLYVFNLIVQIMSETLPDLTDLLPPSGSDASIALNTSIADSDLLKLFV